MPGRLRLLLLLLLIVVGRPPATVAHAADFILRDGEVVEGRLVASTRNTLTILRTIGGIRQIPAASVEQVRIRSGSGKPVAGPVHALQGGRLAVDAPGRGVVWIEGDRAIPYPACDTAVTED